MFVISIMGYLPINEVSSNDSLLFLYIGGVLVLLVSSAGRDLLAKNATNVGVAMQALLDYIERSRIIGDIPEEYEKKIVDAVVKFVGGLNDHNPKG